MLDFRRSQSPPPLLRRRDQLRLLALIALLGFMLLAIKTAAKPSTWYWMLGKPEDRAASNEATATEEDRTAIAVFHSQPSEPKASVPSVALPESGTDSSDSASTRLPLPHALDRTLLRAVQDNALISPGEQEAYFHTLAYASRVGEVGERQPAKNITFASLFADPAAHRGERVSLRGHVRRVSEFEAGTNAYGFEKLYEAWLFTPDSGTNPYVVVCSLVPEEMPLGDGVLEEVRTDGYFFKKYLYRAGDGMRLAPLVLADRLVWLRSAPASAPHSFATYLLGSAAAVVVGIVVSLWVFARTRRRFATPEADRFAEPSREDLDALGELESASESPNFDGV